MYKKITTIKLLRLYYLSGNLQLFKEDGTFSHFADNKMKETLTRCGDCGEFQNDPRLYTEEEQNNIKEEQAINKTKIGIYGMYAVDRDLSLEEVKEKLVRS